MGSAFTWVTSLVEWLGAFIPRWVVLDTTEAAIKYVKGQPKYCAPGAIHWHWPATTVWSTYPIARQSDRLETQTMETADGVSFLVSGTLTYSVDDLEKLLPLTYSAMTTVIEIAQTAIHDVLCDLTWAEMHMAQRKGTIKTMLRLSAQRELSDYGVRVIRFKLNSLAKCRVYRLSQSNSSEEN